ncbi:glycosyltransferase family 39 protein [Candidatus Magnetominusculus dajiuhuensis]|uniref:glycosyltransferase family 39 protein n=1 Tax=Candidatus Magnetominusculus dajiuhuensis TaxID=3137712 RepID=UPI003B42AE45
MTKDKSKNNPAPSPPSINLTKQRAAVAVMFLFFAAILFTFMLKEPYHYDTVLYMKTVDTFKDSSKLQCFFDARCLTGYTLVPLGIILGKLTLPVTMGLCALISLFFYYLWIKELAGFRPAFISTLFLFITPAALMTITHLKEDFIGLMYLSAALWLAGRYRHAYCKYISGVVLGLAILSKDTITLFLPFFAFFAYMSAIDVKDNWTDILKKVNLKKGLIRVGIIMGAALAVSLIIDSSHFIGLIRKTKSPYDGQFMGVFSALFPMGVAFWRYGVGNFLFVGQFIGLAAPFLVKDRTKRLIYLAFAVQFLAISDFYCNITVVKYRHFLWQGFMSFPLMIVVIDEILKRYKIKESISNVLIYGTAIIISAVLFMGVYPALSFHTRYNPVADFFKNSGIAKDNATVLGMDNCVFPPYFMGLQCGVHPLNPSEAAAREYANGVLSSLQGGRAIYLLPDFFSYDRTGTLRAVFSKYFTGRVVYRNWFIDFHAMDYGYSPGELKDNLLSQYPPGTCAIQYEKTGDDTILTGKAENVPVEIYTYKLQCGDNVNSLNAAVIKGRAFTGLEVEGIIQLLPKKNI